MAVYNPTTLAPAVDDNKLTLLRKIDGLFAGSASGVAPITVTGLGPPPRTPPPFASDINEWWDNQLAYYSTTGSAADQWTGRQNGITMGASGAARPVLEFTNGVYRLVFDGTKVMTISSSASIDLQNYSAFIAVRYDTNTNITGILAPDPGNNRANLAVGADNQVEVYNTDFRTSGKYIGNNLTVMHAIGTAAGVDIGISSEHATVTANQAATVLGAYFGSWSNAGFNWQGRVLAVLLYSRALNATERNQVIDWFAADNQTESSATTNFVAVLGDSLTFGTGSTDSLEFSFISQLFGLMGVKPKYVNQGSPGSLIRDGTAGTDVIAVLGHNGAFVRYAHICWGTNDINAGRTSLQIIADFTTLISNIRAGNAGVKIAVSTIPPRSDFVGQPTDITRQAVNTFLMNTADADYRLNLESDSRLINPFDATIYVDGLHMTNLGYSYWAADLKTALGL